MKKKVLSILLAGAMAVSMAACGSSSETSDTESETTEESSAEDSAEEESSTEDSAEEETSEASAGALKVGCVVKFQHSFYTSLMQGAEDACDELGWEFTGEAPNSADDVDGQVQMVEDMVTDGVDVLLVAPNQESTLYNAMDTAVDNGAMVIAVDTDLEDYDKKTAYCGTDNYNALYTAGETLAEMLGEGSNVIILRGALGDANHEKRAAGATAGLEDNGCNVLECFDAGSTAEGAAAAMDDFITKYGDEIDGVLCCGDDMASGAIQSVSQAGMEDQIKVSGFDGLDIGIENVANGSQVFDLTQSPYEMGYQAVYIAYAAANGEDYEETTDTGVELITADNVKDYQ